MYLLDLKSKQGFMSSSNVSVRLKIKTGLYEFCVC